MITFLRILRSGFLNFWRHIWLSAAATLVMVITLVMLSVLLILYGVTSYSVSSIRDRVDISVYFKTGLPENQIFIVKEELEQLPKIREVKYISAQEALLSFKNRHRNDPLVLQSLEELTDNPLPASLQIKAINLESYPEIAEQLKDPKYQNAIAKVNFEDNRMIIERMGRILNFVVTGGIALGAIFSLAAILVIVNTFTLTIYNRREEIEIMRLVGATNWYIRGPFIVEGILYSLLAAIITGLLFLPIFINILPQVIFYIAPELETRALLAPGDGILIPPSSNFIFLVVSQFLLAVFLSITSSLFAMRKYLKI